MDSKGCVKYRMGSVKYQLGENFFPQIDLFEFPRPDYYGLPCFISCTGCRGQECPNCDVSNFNWLKLHSSYLVLGVNKKFFSIFGCFRESSQGTAEEVVDQHESYESSELTDREFDNAFDFLSSL